MTHPTLFDADLKRVSSRIAQAILSFCEENSVFRMESLRLYVEKNVGKIAPASTDRVLRDLRARKKLRYVVLSRKDSMYQIMEVCR